MLWKYREIGSIFKHNKKTLMVAKSRGWGEECCERCDDCFFAKRSFLVRLIYWDWTPEGDYDCMKLFLSKSERYNVGVCVGRYRKDQTNVIFVEVKEVEVSNDK